MPQFWFEDKETKDAKFLGCSKAEYGLEDGEDLRFIVIVSRATGYNGPYNSKPCVYGSDGTCVRCGEHRPPC
jgi:hypothetical protein